MSTTFSRLGWRLAAAGHAGRWELLCWYGHGLRPSHPHAPPQQLAESMAGISRRAAAARCYWTLNGNWTMSEERGTRSWKDVRGEKLTVSAWKQVSRHCFQQSAARKENSSKESNHTIYRLHTTEPQEEDLQSVWWHAVKLI